MKRSASLLMTVAWPAFLMAGVLEMLVFSFIDPTQLHAFGGAPIDWSPTTVYSLAFFVFWVVIAMASAITQLLAEPAAEINSRSFR
jgi:hypothetical protein